MPVCPKCSTKIANANKKLFTVGTSGKTGEQIKLVLGFFVCHKCGKKFLKTLVDTDKDGGSLKGTVQEINNIEKELKHMQEDLRKKLERLKSERSELLEEIESLKRSGEMKANALEDEISSLREEVESLKKMLGDNE